MMRSLREVSTFIIQKCLSERLHGMTRGLWKDLSEYFLGEIVVDASSLKIGILDDPLRHSAAWRRPGVGRNLERIGRRRRDPVEMSHTMNPVVQRFAFLTVDEQNSRQLIVGSCSCRLSLDFVFPRYDIAHRSRIP